MFSYFDEKRFICINKPDGISTHSPTLIGYGFIEFLSDRLGFELYPVHRLDKDTSGLLLFAKDKDSAKELSLKFENQEVTKIYLLVTDRKVSAKNLKFENFIEKKGGKFVIDNDRAPNSITNFEVIKSYKALTLIRAFPKTGKSHQIRIHAKELGFPILGDEEHDGSKFSRLMLLAESLKFEFDGKEFFYESGLMELFINLESLLDSDSFSIKNEYYKRALLFDLNKNFPLRLISNKEKFGFKCDQYGDKLWFYWYKEFEYEKSGQIDSNQLKIITLLLKLTKLSKYHIAFMVNKGKTTDIKPAYDNFNENEWFVNEAEVKLHLKNNQGASAGLFIDQRANRKWIRSIANNKSVLNLFSYTGSLGLFAISGGAKSLISVDTSKATHEWAKQNFVANGYEEKISSGDIKFIVADAREYLERLKKKDLKFDLIICDPPSFARSKSGIFSFEKDFEALLKLCIECRTTDGTILFSTNFEKWDDKEFQTRVQFVLDNHFSNLKLQTKFRIPDIDCGMPMEYGVLKSVEIWSAEFLLG